MKQLKMYRLPDIPVTEEPLPEGYSFSNYSKEEERKQWYDICLDGLTDGMTPESAWERFVTRRTDLDPYRDMFFLDYRGEHIGTITAYVHREENFGDVHVVSIRSDFRGKGLAKYMTQRAIARLNGEPGLRFIELTTDEFRLPAVKGYLSAGFLPVEYDVGMTERWEKVLDALRIDSVPMLTEDAAPFGTVYRSGLKR